MDILNKLFVKIVSNINSLITIHVIKLLQPVKYTSRRITRPLLNILISLSYIYF